MKKPETVLTAFRLPKILSDQVDRVSNGNRSEYIRKAVTEKLEREKEQNGFVRRKKYLSRLEPQEEIVTCPKCGELSR